MRILILFLILALRMTKELGPINQNINKGYCKNNDSVNTILSRIRYCVSLQWTNKYNRTLFIL